MGRWRRTRPRERRLVRDERAQRALTAFPTLDAQTQGTMTVLSGTLTDQAALYGVLAQLDALGLELLEVRRHRL